MEQKDLRAMLLDAKAFTDAHAQGGSIAQRELRCLVERGRGKRRTGRRKERPVAPCVRRGVFFFA